MWELDHKEGWALKNGCFQIVVLEKILESPLDHKEIKPVNPAENQPWIFIGSTDTKAEAPILWPPDVKTSLNGKEWWQRTRWLDSITDSVDMSLSKFWEIMKGREDCCAAVHGIAKSWTQLSDWSTTGTSRHHRSCTIALEGDHLLLWKRKLPALGAPRGLNVCGFTERIVSF